MHSYKNSLPKFRAGRSEQTVSALSLRPHDDGHTLLENIFRASNWSLYAARTWREAADCLKENPVHVVITECDLPDCDWKEILNELRRFSLPPPLIVTSRLADELLWADVLNMGGYDVLAQPFDPEEVIRVVSAARRQFAPAPSAIRKATKPATLAATG